MSDQNQPKLSLEEELDVLEAAYKIGREKGLELLRPELLQKLKDSKRLKGKKTYAFVDSQNVNLSIKEDVVRKGKKVYVGWRVDFERLRVYLADKYGVSKAILFIGYVAGNEALYTYLQQAGYILVFKPTLSFGNNGGVKIKGNVDGELILYAVSRIYEYDEAMIVAGDGDYHCLAEYLEQKGKLRWILVPNRWSYSSLLRKFADKIRYLDGLRSKIGKK